MTEPSVTPLTRQSIAESVRSLGLKPGGVVFMHSSLSSLGEVDGGADTVVDALLDVLGPEGTLAVPTFSSINRRRGRAYDPDRTPSEVGHITNTLRSRPNAFRSPHLWQSMSAIGKRAEEMMSVHRPAAWAADGPFWRLYEWDAHIMLLGVPYFRSTFWHLIEQWVQPAYARWKTSTGRVRHRDGTESPLQETTFGPKPGYSHDFNKFGSRLEAKGLVNIGTIGNAMARLYRARDAFDTGVAEYRRDPTLMIGDIKALTQLPDGVIVGPYNNEKSVVDPEAGYKPYE
jgi:aminoglycoside 3-N-acetyltransferase